MSRRSLALPPDLLLTCPLALTLSPTQVPTLLLAASDDAVVPLAATRAFADVLRAAQPERALRLETVKGAHVRLLSTSPKASSPHRIATRTAGRPAYSHEAQAPPPT